MAYGYAFCDKRKEKRPIERQEKGIFSAAGAVTNYQSPKKVVLSWLPALAEIQSERRW
jgi:hypothetical protein